MVAAKYNILIEQGADYIKNFKYLTNIPADLLTSTIRMTAKDLVATTEYIDISTLTGEITVASDSFTINLPSATTATYSFDQALYDLELVSTSGVVTRLLEGTVTLSDEITK